MSLLFRPQQLREEAGGVLRHELSPEDARELATALLSAADGLPVLSGDVGVRGQG